MLLTFPSCHIQNLARGLESQLSSLLGCDRFETQALCTQATRRGIVVGTVLEVAREAGGWRKMVRRGCCHVVKKKAERLPHILGFDSSRQTNATCVFHLQVALSLPSAVRL